MRIDEVILDQQKPALLDVRNEVEANCVKYVKELGSVEHVLFNYPMYRGMANFSWPIKNQPWTIVDVNQNRRPRDTPRYLHDMADDWFESRTDVRFRSSSLHCSGSITTAQHYSNIYGMVVIVVPVGEYQYCWSPIVHDLTDAFDDYNVEEHDDEKTQVDKVLAKGDYRLNAGLQQALLSKNEIMLHCQKALIISSQWIVEQMIELGWRK